MAEFVSFSEKQRILKPEDWERAHILDGDCKTVRVATQIMRKVIERLLQIDKSGKISVDDFEFVVSDDAPNAAFISTKYTLNGKPAILITNKITELANTEDEFAGILAHELGHFTYDKIYGDNKNTIFQERLADLHAVDLLIAGGYDPVAYSRVCEKMKNMSGHNFFPDVHGSSIARKEDVDAYLTQKHKNTGEFKISAPTGLWNGFVTMLNSGTDTYKPYFKSALKHHFKDRQPKLHEALDFIISEMRNEKLNNYQRMSDAIYYIINDIPETYDIKHTQAFAEQLFELQTTNETVSKCLHSSEILDLYKVMKKKFRGGKTFKPFGPFVSNLAKIQEFMTTRDVSRIKELLSQLNYTDIPDLKRIFGEPRGFPMPPRKLAKHKTISTDWLVSISSELTPDEKNKLHWILNYIGYDCNYKFLTDKAFDKVPFNLGEYCGKILATNDKEIEKLKEQHHIQEEYKNQHHDFNGFMKAITVLYEFDTGKISVTDAIKVLAEYGNRPDRRTLYNIDSIVYWMHDAIFLADYKHNNPFIKQEIAELNNSLAFAEMCIKPFLKLLNDTAPELKISTKTPPHGKTWFEYLADVSKLLKLKRNVVIRLSDNNIRYIEGKWLDNLNHSIHKTGIPEKQDYAIWNSEFGPITYIVSGMDTGKLNSVFIKFVNEAVTTGDYSKDDAIKLLLGQVVKGRVDNYYGFSENPVLNNMCQKSAKIIDKATQDLIENYSVLATTGSQWILDEQLNTSAIGWALESEISSKTDMHLMKRFLTVSNMLANNEQELVALLSKTIQPLQSNGLCSLEIKLKMYALTYYLRNNAPIKNLYQILFALRLDNISEFTSDFSDELHDYIEKHHLMPTDFQSMFDFYVIMERLNLFSKEASAQSKLLNILIEQIQKMSHKDIEKYSYKLLSGFYYDDDDDRAGFCNRKSKTMDFPLAKQKLMEMYSDVVVEHLGRDDNSDEYFTQIKDFVDFISGEHTIKFYGNYEKYVEYIKECYKNKQRQISRWDDERRHALNRSDNADLYRLISDKIQSQERVSQILNVNKDIALKNCDMEKYDLPAQCFESLLDELERDKELSIYTIEFLNTKVSKKSISDYRNKCAKYIAKNPDLGAVIKQETLENLYNTFWSSGLGVRSFIMNKLLNRAFDTLSERIKFVVDMNFDKNDKNRTDAEMIFECVINSFDEYEQGLILSAVASAEKNKQEGKNASRSVGDALRMFFENMGPAWVKFGQLLSYVPQLPSEIRRDLGKLKDQADIPARWDLYSDMADALPNELRNRIERVEDIIGAGSFWVTAIVQFKNDDGKTEKKVLQLLRPYAGARADAGFNVIEKAVDELSKRDRAYKILKNVAQQAHNSSEYEVDVEFGNKQYKKAKELYGNISVSIDGKTYTPNVADWRYCGVGKNKIGYKIMDYASGKTLGKVDASLDERRKMALAYFTIEMTNLFKGDVWDIDRHQGQQNFDIVSPNHVNINIYDTGAQLPQAPNKKNKVLLAWMFFNLIKAVQSGKSIDSCILKIIKRLEKIQKNLKVDVSYVSNVQKGLMALSDIIEYQKELKDSDGNIIQERKVLSAEDLKNAVISVLHNPSVDKYFYVIIGGRYMANKLTHGEVEVLKELKQKDMWDDDNPVRIDITENDAKSVSRSYNKAQAEIDALYNPDDYIMGIPKANVKMPRNKDKSVIDALKQMGLSLG